MVICNECDGKCCKYISVGIDEPKNKEDFDELKWFLHHKKVIVYLDEEDEWIVEFQTPCRYLDENNKCMIYDKRPDVCKEHSLDECDLNGDGESHKILLEKPEDVDKYHEEVFLKKK